MRPGNSDTSMPLSLSINSAATEGWKPGILSKVAFRRARSYVGRLYAGAGKATRMGPSGAAF